MNDIMEGFLMISYYFVNAQVIGGIPCITIFVYETKLIIGQLWTVLGLQEYVGYEYSCTITNILYFSAAGN